MRELLAHNTRDYSIFMQAAQAIRPCDTLLDVGSGIRPQTLVECNRHICAEPHSEYADVLEENGMEVIRATATDALDQVGDVDTIVALDVLEHMEREEGEEFIRKALAKAAQQVVIFTPLGFMPQDGGAKTDPWGFQGQEWQRHKSGWTPSDFEGWTCLVQEEFHERKGTYYDAFFAIHG